MDVNKTIYLLLLSILLGCETVVYFDIPDFRPAIVMNAVINPDSLVKVNLTENNYILDTQFVFDPIETAKVLFFENNQLIAQIPYQGNGNYVLNNGFKPVPGNSYRLEAKDMLYDSVFSEITLPDDRTNTMVSSINNFTEVGVNFMEITIDITGYSTSDYYIMEFYGYQYKYDNQQTPPVLIDSALIQLYERSYDGFLGVDTEFAEYFLDGQQLTTSQGKVTYVFLDNLYSSDGRKHLLIYIKKISEGYYYYKRDLAAISNQPDFTEPLNVSNNIVNGYGIFGGYVNHVIDTIYY